MKVLWLIYPFCSIFIVVGLGICYFTLRGISKARAVTKWPTIDADVISCDFDSSTDSEGGTTYEVKVEYKYRVNGKDYVGSKLHPAYSASSFEGHRPLYDRLKKAEVVRASYDPADPSDAYLITGSYSSHWTGFFAGMIFASAGLFFLLTFHFAIAGNSDYAAGLNVVR